MQNKKILGLSFLSALVFGLFLTASLAQHFQILSSHADAASNTASFQVVSSADVANQDGIVLSSSNTSAWIGTGKDTNNSYVGFLFRGSVIPANATITSAKLTVVSTQSQWLSVRVTGYAENTLQPEAFTTDAKLLSARLLSSGSQSNNSNTKWVGGSKYSYDVTAPLQSLPSDHDRIVISLIFKGTGQSYGRKFFYTSGTQAPTLTVTYTTGITQGPTNTPTPVVIPTQMPSSMPMPTGKASGNSAAMGLWNPNPKFDTCPTYPPSADTNQDGTIDQTEKNAYIKAIHDSYKVKGPDGKWYPTWHPPVDPATGCKFGHEHGQDPSKSPIWAEVKDHYAYVNPDGTKDLSHAGIPFAYVNEQMDVWTAANGNTIPMRHEDHVGHKIAIANNFPIGLNKIDGGQQFFYPGVTCNYIVKVHQGTHSKDAFENNLHEILYNVHCSDGHRVNLDSMGKFGKPGEFTRSCDSAGDRTSIIKTGFDYSNANYPDVDESIGTRGISDRSCVETGFLVPQGQFSQNPYEFWPVVIGITKKDGTPLVDWLNLLFDVEDSIRYYYPGHTDPTTGVVDNLGHFQDLCYENLNGRTFRGNLCDESTNFGAIQGITWDDPRAGFKDLNRGTYFKPSATHNAGGQNIWYTDPFGNNAQNTPFTGSLQQYVSSDSINYSQLANANETANVINMVHDNGGGTVHAPN